MPGVNQLWAITVDDALLVVEKPAEARTREVALAGVTARGGLPWIAGMPGP
jgi:hypothetical protein